MAHSSTSKATNCDWRTLLAAPKLLIDPVVKQQTLDKLQSSAGNANNVAALIQTDPALTAIIIANSNRSMSSGKDVNSLAHAISLSGFPQIEKLINDSDDVSNANPHYQRELSSSLHAAYQAYEWASLNPFWPADAVFWASLLQQAPYWALWAYAPESMVQLRATQTNLAGTSPKSLQLALFGDSLGDILTELATTWQLPLLAQQSWQPKIVGSKREWIALSQLESNQALANKPALQRILAHPAFAVTLANQFAYQAEWDWFSHRTFRLLKILAMALNITIEQAIALTHSKAAQLERSNAFINTPHPASMLLAYYKTAATNDDTRSHQPKDPSIAMPKQQAADKPRIAASITMDETLKIFNKVLPTTETIERMMTLTVSSMCELSMLERAAIFRLNLKDRTLTCQYHHGMDENVKLAGFSHRLQRGNVFNKLLQKPISVRLHEGNRDKIWPLLPEEFKQTFKTHEFLMMSIFAGKKPIGIAFADQGNTGNTINDHHYTQFKQWCTALNQFLQRQ